MAQVNNTSRIRGFTVVTINTNPRDGSVFAKEFGECATLAEAKKVGKKELNGTRWGIVEHSVVFDSLIDGKRR